MKQINRRRFMKFTGLSLGIGTLYRVIPALGADSALGGFLADMRRSNGESMSPFTFIQLSDSHVGFNGPPNPTGTAAFERAVEVINGLPQTPELVLFTVDLTHDSEDKDVHAARMAQFRKIAGGIKAPKLRFVPGEHDAGLDGGILFRENFGETHYSFDHRGIHFVGLDNVSRAKPEVGPEQLGWLRNDLARFPRTTPIVVFTHRPLFDLKPDWEWFTSDGDDVMNTLAPYENVTVLYGHIHRDHELDDGHIHHYAARSLIFAFPDPAVAPEKKPLPFDKEHPFKNLGLRTVADGGPKTKPQHALAVNNVELTLREYGGVNGIQQLLRKPSF